MVEGRFLTRAMFMTRYFGRSLLAVARSESSAGTAAAAATVTGHNPLEAFFEADRSPEDDKPVVYGMVLFSLSFLNSCLVMIFFWT